MWKGLQSSLSQLMQATTIEITLKAYMFNSNLSEIISVTLFMFKFVRTLLIHTSYSRHNSSFLTKQNRFTNSYVTTSAFSDQERITNHSDLLTQTATFEITFNVLLTQADSIKMRQCSL